MNRRGGPQARRRRLDPLPLPASSPELNPAERLFERSRGALANRVFDSLAELEQALTAALRPDWDQPQALARLTGYPWWRDAAQTITTSSM